MPYVLYAVLLFNLRLKVQPLFRPDEDPSGNLPLEFSKHNPLVRDPGKTQNSLERLSSLAREHRGEQEKRVEGGLGFSVRTVASVTQI